MTNPPPISPEEIAGRLSEAPCPKCDDSGWIEFISGGLWTGEGATRRLEVCDCICGESVRDEALRAALSRTGEVSR